MKAVEIASPGGPEVLRATSRPVPVPARGEVLIKVAAAGVNRPDVLQRMGKYPPPPGASELPGLEVSGTICGLGPDVRPEGFAMGAEVCALLAGGGYAEFVAVPVEQVLPVPDGMSMEAAAGLPETAFTVWANVFDRGRLREGESFLVHGGTSGIGTTAIQLARARGARVFATAGSEAKCRACVALGAERAIDYRKEDFAEVLKEQLQGRGVDVILDMVGGSYLSRNVASLAVEGRLIFIAFIGGVKTEINLAPVMMKRLTITGSTLRARSPAEKGAIAEALRREVWPLYASGAVRVVVHRVFPLEQAAEAHAALEAGDHVGKIVLQVG
ncbi:NAD(P)H-quinone oxidoreductase [Congregicoccus parvus]|uniref:NAD(P)H-quinone oxidoreductase n=1 Tax=Congregicoccus parvus TaxID=3081749 RepID=UPI003FA5D059